MKPITGQWVVIYGPHAKPHVYTTVYCDDELVIACGYARIAYPGEDVRALPAGDVPLEHVAK